MSIGCRFHRGLRSINITSQAAMTESLSLHETLRSRPSSQRKGRRCSEPTNPSPRVLLRPISKTSTSSSIHDTSSPSRDTSSSLHDACNNTSVHGQLDGTDDAKQSILGRSAKRTSDRNDSAKHGHDLLDKPCKRTSNRNESTKHDTLHKSMQRQSSRNGRTKLKTCVLNNSSDSLSYPDQVTCDTQLQQKSDGVFISPRNTSGTRLLRTTGGIDIHNHGMLDTSLLRKSGSSDSSGQSDICEQTCIECNKNKPACICLDCTSCMCADCQHCHSEHTGHHKIQQVTNTSGIVGISSVTGQPSRDCACCISNAVDVYCSDHMEFICRQCETNEHNSCETVSFEELLIDTDLSKLKSKLSKVLKKHLANFVQYRQGNNIDTLKRHKESLAKESEKFTEELINAIKENHEKFIGNLDNEFDTGVEMVQTCERCIENIQLDIQKVEQPKQRSEKNNNSTQIQLLKTIEDKGLSDYKKVEEKLKEGSLFLKLIFNPQITLLEYIKKSNIGVLCSGKENGRSSNPHSNSEARTLTGGTLTGVTKNRSHGKLDKAIPICEDSCEFVSCWTEGDCGSKTSITDSIVVGEDTILLADNKNHKIKLLQETDDDFAVLSSVDVEGEPWQLSEYDTYKFVATVLKPSEPTCVFINIMGTSISVDKSLTLKKECTGIAVTGSDIILCGYDGDHAYIIVIDNSGKVTNEISFYGKGGLRRPNYLCVSVDDSLLFVSDADKGVVGLRTNDLNNIVFRYKEGIKCALGMTLTNNGELLVCAAQSHSIYRLSKDGKLIEALRLGHKQLQSVCRLKDSRLLVSSDDAGYNLILIQIQSDFGST